MKPTNDNNSVLIVDDDKDLCNVLKASLPRGVSVHVEHCLSQASSYLDHHKPSLLFLDNSLPDGKGMDFIAVAMRMDKNIIIVMMTADSVAGVKDQAIQRGASYFIPKPFRMSLVRDIVRAVFPNVSAA